MNLHQNHKILRITDEEALKKENLTVDFSTKEFDDDIQNLDILKNAIEKEMIAIDKEYERLDEETTKSYNLKREKLNKDEEELKDRLQNEVTKIKENMEKSLSKVNNLLKTCEKIKKGINSFEKEEKVMIQTLSYISCINKNQIEMNLLINSKIKNLKINFNEEKSIIEYDEYYFNGKENTYLEEKKLLESINVESYGKKSSKKEKYKEEDYINNLNNNIQEKQKIEQKNYYYEMEKK